MAIRSTRQIVEVQLTLGEDDNQIAWTTESLRSVKDMQYAPAFVEVAPQGRVYATFHHS
jgi:hypothetical protein